MNREEKLDQFWKLQGTLKMTFTFPKVAPTKDENKMPLTIKDVDFIEIEILRQFFINVQRVVDFNFVAYPEDRAYNDERKFVGLHYHAVAKSKNDKKFIKVAPKKYEAILRSRFTSLSLPFLPPNNPLFIEFLYLDPTTSYEDYCLKQYDPSKRIVTDVDFRQKCPLRLTA